MLALSTQNAPQHCPPTYSQPGAAGSTVGSSHGSGVGVRSSSESRGHQLWTNDLHAADRAECETDTQTSSLQSLPPSPRDDITMGAVAIRKLAVLGTLAAEWNAAA